VLTVVVAVALLTGGRRVVREVPTLGVAAAAGFVLAGAAHLPGGETALEWLVVHVPGSGLLRDGQKWLLPYVALVVACAGAAAASAAAALRRRDPDLGRLLPAALVLLPVLVLPDAAGRTWEALAPVDYPADLARAVDVLDGQEGGDVATAPWSSYRRFSWGNDLSAADPLPRWTRHPTVVADSLAVRGGSVGGEDARAAEVGAVMGSGGPVAGDLAGLDVGWVLVYLDQPGAGDLDLTGAERVVDGPDVALYRLPDAEGRPREAHPGWAVGLDALWGLAGLAGLAGTLWMSTKRRRGC
jgi:hypothetical protein